MVWKSSWRILHVFLTSRLSAQFPAITRLQRYSNHYGCVCCTVLADNFGFRRRKALDFQTSVCQVTNKFLKLFFKKLDKSVFISFFHLPLTNTKIISPYRSPIHTPFEFPPYCGFSTITFRYMIKNK